MKLVETILAKPILEEVSRDKLPEGVLCRVTYPICNIGQRNANNRVYEDEVWEAVCNEKELQEKMENRRLFGHAEHPNETQSNLEKTSHVIFEMWKDDGIMWQKMDVVDTPCGRIVDALLRANCQVGVSTRAEGDLEEAEDEDGTYHRVVPESYRYVTTDFTADPSTPGALPHDVRRNVVSEIKKVLEGKDVNESERKFATCLLEGMKCEESKGECGGCGRCEILKEQKKVAEKKTIEQAVQEGIIKEGMPINFIQDGNEMEGKVTKVEEGKEVDISIPGMDSSGGKEVKINGAAYVIIELDGTIFIQPEQEAPPCPGPGEPPVEMPEPGNTGMGMPAVTGDETPEELMKDEPVPEAKKDPKAKVRNRGDVIFPAGSSKVKDDKDHFPINNKAQARNALSRANQYSKAPPWYKGSLEDLVKKVASAVKRKYKNIEVSKAAEKPGKESIEVDDQVILTEGDYENESGKVTTIDEQGVGVMLDDGTLVQVENPDSVCITLVPPPKEVEKEPELPPEPEVDSEIVAEPEMPEEEMEEKCDKHKKATKESESEIDEAHGLQKGSVVQNRAGESYVVDSFDVNGVNLEVMGGGVGALVKKSWNDFDREGFTKISETRVDEEDLVYAHQLAQVMKRRGKKEDAIRKVLHLSGLNKDKIDSIIKSTFDEKVKEQKVDEKKCPKCKEKMEIRAIPDSEDNQFECVKCGYTEPVLEEKLDEKKCPKCGAEMSEGAPHAEGDISQWECHKCGHVEGVSESEVDEQKLSTADVKKLFKSIDNAFAKHLTGLTNSKKEVIKRGKEVGLELSDEGKKVLEEAEEVDEGAWTYEGQYTELFNILDSRLGTAIATQMEYLENHEFEDPNPNAIKAIEEELPDLSDKIPGVEELKELINEYNEWAEEELEESEEIDETEDIKKMYRDAGLPAPDGKGIHTKAFHELAIKIAKGYKDGGDSGEEALKKAYPTAMKQLGKEKAVKKAHRKKGKKESISTTAKEIKDLKVKEASTRAERDKTLELLEEATSEKNDLKAKARKEKALEAKILIKKANQTFEAKEREVEALRSKLEEKAKLSADLQKQLDEKVEQAKKVQKQVEKIKSDLSKDITSLKESASAAESKHKKALQEAKVKHEKALQEANEVAKEKIKEAKTETEKRVREEVTKEFIKRFVEFRLSETNLKVDENSRALLEDCESPEQVDDVLDEILDASRRGALHSESISGVAVSKPKNDPEHERAKRSVNNVFEGMNS